MAVGVGEVAREIEADDVRVFAALVGDRRRGRCQVGRRKGSGVAGFAVVGGGDVGFAADVRYRQTGAVEVCHVGVGRRPVDVKGKVLL